jgi:hypothetical protein
VRIKKYELFERGHKSCVIERIILVQLLRDIELFTVLTDGFQTTMEKMTTSDVGSIILDGLGYFDYSDTEIV